MTVEFVLDEIREELNLKEFLKAVDKKFYHGVIENRQKNVANYFPHRGVTVGPFASTFQYVNIGKKKK